MKKITIAAIVLTIVFPLVVVWLGNFVLCLIKSRLFNFAEEFAPRIWQSVIAAIPFLVFYIFSRFKKKSTGEEFAKEVISAGMSVFVFMIVLWGYYYYDAFSSVGGGPNIGIGLMLLISPVLSFIIMLIGFWIARMVHKLRSVDGHPLEEDVKG